MDEINDNADFKLCQTSFPVSLQALLTDFVGSSILKRELSLILSSHFTSNERIINITVRMAQL